jgi:serine palmitoyltransferase
VSAAHTKDDLDRLLRACDEVGDILQLKFSSGIAGETVAPTNSLRIDDVHSNSTKYMDSFASPPKERSLSGTWKKPRWDVEEVIKRGVIDTRA